MNHRILNKIRSHLHRRSSPYWFVSFPKSGRTWVKTILEEYVRELYGIQEFQYEKYAPWLRTGVYRNIPRMVWVHPHCQQVQMTETYDLMDRLRQQRVVVITRNPADVVVTYYYRMRKRMQDKRSLSLSLAEFIRHEELGIHRIVDFTNAWATANDRFQHFLLLRFEDVCELPIHEMKRFLLFLDIPLDESLLSSIIQSTSDTTTTAIEDNSVNLTASDKAFIDSALLNLDPSIGYQVQHPGTED